MKQCSFCAESIQDEAIKCRFCDSMLDGSQPIQRMAGAGSRSFHTQRIWIVVLALAGIVSAFLPWISVPIAGSVAGTDGSDGWIVVGIFVVALLIGLTGSHREPLGAGARIAELVFALAGAAMAIWKISAVYKMKSSVASGNQFEAALSNAISVGAGLWVMAVAGALLVGAALTTRR